MEKLHIAIIAGTTRPGRLSIHAARFVYEMGKKRDDVEVTLVDPENFKFEKDGDNEELKDPEYTRITQTADGFVIVTPEYNHSFPGSLKRMLDSEFENYKHKPVALAGVSNGPWGGVRAIESLLPTLRTMSLVALKTDLQFPKVQEIFDEQGVLQDRAYEDRVHKVYDELVWMATALKWGRNNL